MFTRVSICALVLYALSAPLALACRGAIAETPILFDELPVMPEKAFAAKVEIINIHDLNQPKVIEAKVITLLSKGEKPKKLIITYQESSCDRSPRAGDVGIIVGMVVSKARREFVVNPFRAPSDGVRYSLKLKQEKFVINPDSAPR